MTDAISKLEDALTEAVERLTRAGKIGIAVSGIDSSLIAKICEELGRKAVLYSVCMEGSHDAARVKELEKNFRSAINVIEICESDLETYAKKVMRTIRACDALSIGIEIPLYAACEAAKNDGIETMFLGQGADELFAGYHRYISMPYEKLGSELRRDFEAYRSKGFKKDSAIASANSLELRLPYLEEEVVKAAFETPVELKIKNGIRKYALREVAKRKGLGEIASREKKAIQYSSGVDKALRKLAKNDLKEYLSEMYRSINHGR